MIWSAGAGQAGRVGRGRAGESAGARLERPEPGGGDPTVAGAGRWRWASLSWAGLFYFFCWAPNCWVSFVLFYF